MEKVNQSELIGRIADETGIPKTVIKRVLSSAIGQITWLAKNGLAISLAGLGKFYPVDRKPRVGRNPKTGETVQIPAKRVLAFKAKNGGKIV